MAGDHGRPRGHALLAPCPWQDLAEAESALAADREAYANGDQLKLGMYRRDNGELIGMVQLFNIDDVSRRGEIGYCLASAVQGRATWTRH